MKKLVCFSEETWIRLREVLKKPALEKKSSTRCKKEKAATNDRANKADQGREVRGTSFSLDGIRIRKWWERENWAMVTDPENPLGDLTREEEFKLREILKGDGNRYL